MFGNLRPFPAMKDSGVPWLGKVPEHWGIERPKWLFHKMDRPVLESDEVVTCFRDGVVTLRKNRRVRGFTESLKEIGYQGVLRGDLVIHAMDAFAGAIGVADSDGKGTPVYSVCQPRERTNAYYYAYFLREMARAGWILALAKGIRERSTDFRFDDFAAQVVPLPPPAEQSAIVSFLDYADKRIKRFIAAKRRLIELLNEQKQAIIQKAVTRGLDPNVRLFPSGIHWLGDVPDHWQPVQVRRIVSLVTSGSRGWAQYYSDDGKVFLQSGNLGRSMELDLSFVQHVSPPEDSEGMRTRVRRDDVLVCITGALTGNVALVYVDIDEAYVNQHVALIRPIGERVDPRFLAYVLYSGIGQTQFKTSEYGGTKQGLGLSDVKGVFIALPSMGEQRAIVTHLDARLHKLTALVAHAQYETDRVREYRARLIADVVTGKLDVRGVELPPWEETEDLPALADEAIDEPPEEETELEPVEEGADVAE